MISRCSPWFLVAITLFVASHLHAVERPNVLFIAVDDLRPELGCYGVSHVKSPNIDALAAQGLLFERSYCQLALCNPSRASLLTGRRPETLNIYDLKTNIRDVDPSVVTLPQLFKNNGYRALSFGKIFHTTNGNHEDPASWSEKAWKPKGRPSEKPPAPGEDLHADDLPTEAPDVADEVLEDGQTARKAVEAITANRDKPFFIGVGFHKPHLPFVAPKRYWDLYDPKDIALADHPHLPNDAPAFASNDASEIRRYKGMPKKGPIPDDVAKNLIHGYRACVSYTDAQVGLVLAELDRQNLRDKTIVILWGDHGYQLGEHGTWNKRTNWEIATRTPLILSVPRQAAASKGKKTAALVEFVDIFPTLAELCALPAPAKLDGRSFVPLLTDPAQPWKPAAFSVYEKIVKELGGRTLGRAMRTTRYRLIEWTGPGDNAKRVYELYDHQTDPAENTNLANVAEHQSVLKQLIQQLHAAATSLQN